jgi:protein-disulfide isomerase
MNLKKIAVIAAFVLLAGLGYSAFRTPSPSMADEAAPPAPAAAPAPEAPAPAAATDPAPAAVTIDVKQALSERGLGDPKAPVVVKEFASLSCPHCAMFHKENYAKLKADYIDTGKVYFIFNDFPLNAPALNGSVVARCLPPERYFDFIKFLFDTQDQWVFQDDPVRALRQDAKLVGMDDATLDACLNSGALKTGIADKMKELGDKYKIEATPTFILNETTRVQGEQTYDMFKKQIDDLLANSGSDKK